MQEKHFCLNFDQAIFNLANFFKIKALQCLIFNQILTIIFQSNFNYPCCLVVWYRQQSAFIFKKNDESIHSHAEPDLSEELEPWIDVEGGGKGEGEKFQHFFPLVFSPLETCFLHFLSFLKILGVFFFVYIFC